MDDVEVLLGTNLFHDLTPAELSSLLSSVSRQRLNKGAYFYRVGERSERAWVLISGQAKMTMLTPDGDETVLDVMLPGELFGLPGLFSSTDHRVAESVATEPCEALSIEGRALAEFVERNPVVMRRTLTRLADLVREYAEAIALAAHDGLRGRVARRLLDLAGLHGEQDQSGVRIGAKVPQDTLAAMVGASRAKVNRALAELIAQGHIRLDAGVITLLDADRLRADHPDWFATTHRPRVSRGA
jgi:CRP-like cAMP-binding protein